MCEAELCADQDVRVLCLVMTHPGNHQTRALQVARTWGRRCSYLRFLTTQEDQQLETYVSNSTEVQSWSQRSNWIISQFTRQAYDHIWGKTKYGFKRAYEEFYDKVDWVMKADDDTYVVLENLRFLLSDYNSSDPIWFGCEFNVIVKEGYMSGGAGYVLSKGKRSQYTQLAIVNQSDHFDDLFLFSSAVYLSFPGQSP